MGSLHRVGAAVVGGFVFVFGLAGLAARPEVYSTEGPVVFGMTTNGLLAFASLAVGIVLLFATVLGGQVVAWAAIAAGAAFFLSGVVNVFLLGTSLNVMAFTMPNVVFSWVVGAVLVALGVIGRQQHQTSDNLSGSHVEREGAAPQATPIPSLPQSWPRPSAPSHCTTRPRSRSSGCTRPTSTGQRPIGATPGKSRIVVTSRRRGSPRRSP